MGDRGRRLEEQIYESSKISKLLKKEARNKTILEKQEIVEKLLSTLQ